MPVLSGRVPVLAIRKSDERFSTLKGVTIDDVEKVCALFVKISFTHK